MAGGKYICYIISFLIYIRVYFVLTSTHKYLTYPQNSRFGKDCHYAHSQNELAKHAPSAEDLMKDDRLLRPCVIMVMTGKW